MTERVQPASGAFPSGAGVGRLERDDDGNQYDQEGDDVTQQSLRGESVFLPEALFAPSPIRHLPPNA